MAQRIFYYMEIKNPNIGESNDVIGSMTTLLDAHIAETNSKKSRVMKETVFADATVFNTVGDMQAVTLEFLNERNYDTYIASTSEFRAWVAANHSVEYVTEKTSSTGYQAAQRMTGDESSYYTDMRTYMNVVLPTERGFL